MVLPVDSSNLLCYILVKRSGAKTFSIADGSSSQNNAYTSEEYLKVTEEQLKAAAAQQQGQTPSQSVSQLEAQTISQDSVSSAGGAYTTEVNLETGDQQPKAASSQDQEQGQKSSPAATVKETAS
ncbi:hypothetical protein L484_004323 [Morus notabilis]|uniref:Uncharacterized protein n=1 Tax=Morus notabilis TaxID=981085 RepID=W9RUF6_9ROSA|nr:hypothetical protein L484_004323 [Morus notabilis]